VDGTTCSASETTPTELRPYRIENGKPVFHKSFWTTYSKTKVSGDGKPFTTVQVVHPFLKDADAAKAAASIQFTEVGDGTAKLRLPTDGHGIVEVTIHGDGATATWKAN
jgi:hypothetical protein